VDLTACLTGACGHKACGRGGTGPVPSLVLEERATSALCDTSASRSLSSKQAEAF